MRSAFRLFELTVRCRGSEPQDWGPDERDHFVRAIEQLHQQGTVHGSPRSQSAVSASEDEGNLSRKAVPAFTVTEPPMWIDPGQHVHFGVSKGEQGLHDFASGPEGERVPMESLSAQSSCRVDVWFPKDDTRAFVALEMVQGASAVKELQTWLNHTQHQAVVGARAADSAERAAARSEGREVPAKVARHMLYFRFVGAVDSKHIEDLIQGAQQAVLTLSQQSAGGAGAAKVRERELRWRAVDTETRNRFIKIVQRWANSLTGDVSLEDEISLVVDDLKMDDDALDSLDLNFDEVQVQLDATGVARRTFTPADVDEVFSYPLAAGVSNHSFYYDQVIERVRKVAHELEIPVHVVNPQVVAGCLPDSSPGLPSPGSGTGSKAGE